jgi:hypothetical protein
MPAVAAQVVVGFGYYANYGAELRTVSFYSESGSRMHVNINKGTDGRVIICRSNAPVATSSAVHFTNATWSYIEVKCSVADTGGYVEVRVNGVLAVTYTGDTKNGGVGTTANIDMLQFEFSPSSTTRYDDLYVLDTTGSAPYNDFLGEKVIKAKRLVGNGALNQLVGSDGDSIDNYLLVDDDPVNVTDYVSSNVAGVKDLYQLSAATGLLTVDAVQTHLYTSKSDSGSRSVKHLIRQDGTGTVDTGATKPLSTNWQFIPSDVKITNPDGVAWTPASVNQIQAGLEVV